MNELHLSDMKFDILISQWWDGEEGQEFEGADGTTFKVYSSIEEANKDNATGEALVQLVQLGVFSLWREK